MYIVFWKSDAESGWEIRDSFVDAKKLSAEFAARGLKSGIVAADVCSYPAVKPSK